MLPLMTGIFEQLVLFSVTMKRPNLFTQFREGAVGNVSTSLLQSQIATTVRKGF